MASRPVASIYFFLVTNKQEAVENPKEKKKGGGLNLRGQAAATAAWQ
jgi:hypothetical protein